MASKVKKEKEFLQEGVDGMAAGTATAPIATPAIKAQPKIKVDPQTGNVPHAGNVSTAIDDVLEEEQEMQNDQTQDRFDILRFRSAKDLLDENVATMISNEIARKNTNAQLASMGLDNTGYAATVAAMQGNALQGQLAANQRAYQDALSDIDEQELAQGDQLNAEQANAIANYIDIYSGQALNDYLERNGFVYNDKTQRWDNPNYSKAILDDLNERIKAKGYEQDLAYGIANSKGFGIDADYEQVMANIIMPNGSSADNYEGVQTEVRMFLEDFGHTNPPEGYMVRMTNDHNNQSVYLIFRNGRWVQVNSNAGEAAWAQTDESNKRAYSGAEPFDQRVNSAIAKYDLSNKNEFDLAADVYLSYRNPAPSDKQEDVFKGVKYVYDAKSRKWKRKDED